MLDTIPNTIDFSDIAPYGDHEVQSALKALIEELSFIKVLNFVYPELNIEGIKTLCAEIDSVYAFQERISYPAMKLMINSTVDELTHQGLENLIPTKAHLFISNHRDIILDSAVLNVVLFSNDRNTTETAIGSNLLSNPTVRILTKLNKNFTVQRDVNSRELYEASSRLSAYIRQTVCESQQSVWISQREGRAKDGNDRTQQGLLKMLTMSSDADLAENFEALNVRPLSISYEYDPCDTFKINELLAKEQGVDYVKEEDEDLRSIVAGITGKKGRVHLHIGASIDSRLGELNLIKNKNERFQLLATLIDQAIHRNLHLFPNNYYAADLVQETDMRSSHYSDVDVDLFKEYMDGILSSLGDDRAAGQKILIQKYAWPVLNKEEALGSRF